MTIKEELDKIICDSHKINIYTFDLIDYLYEGWTTEEDFYKAIETLIKRRKTCGGKRRET